MLLLTLVVLVAAVFSCFWNLDLSKPLTLEESHILQQAALYLKQRFFLSEEPPLGKLLLAGFGWWEGWDGVINNTNTGKDTVQSASVWVVRLVPGLCGSLLVPLSMLIVQELKASTGYLAAIAPVVLLADRGVFTQRCEFHADNILLLTMAVSVFCMLKLIHTNRKCRLRWSFWLLLTGVGLGLTVSTAYIGWMTGILVTFLVFRDWWARLPDQQLSHMELASHFLCLVSCVCLLPICVYIIVFYIHLSILTNSGPHDHHMTSAFQATLKGGLSSLTEGQPQEVVYGSQITLRSTHSKVCWLHSHTGLYPNTYPDGRVSSHQQQVSCVSRKDVNNWWIVKHPHRNQLHADSPPVMVTHGDVIQLVHGMTRRALHSHDVAAPLTPSTQEVSCYIDYGNSGPTLNLWRLEIVNRHEVGDIWRPLRSEVKLVHVNTSHVLKTTGKVLPEWGGYQYEVVSDRIYHQAAAVWNVEEHRYTPENKKHNPGSGRDDLHNSNSIADGSASESDIPQNGMAEKDKATAERNSNSLGGNSQKSLTKGEEIDSNDRLSGEVSIPIGCCGAPDTVDGDNCHKSCVKSKHSASNGCDTPAGNIGRDLPYQKATKSDLVDSTVSESQYLFQESFSGTKHTRVSKQTGQELSKSREESHVSRPYTNQWTRSVPPVGFWAKFVEVQQKMWYFVEKRDSMYQYSVEGPLDWLLGRRNILKSQKAENGVNSAGNVLVGLSLTLSLVLYIGLLVTYLVQRKRQTLHITEDAWHDFITVVCMCVVGYFLHVLPSILSEKPLFPHQQMPAFFYNVLLLPVVTEHLSACIRSSFWNQVFHVGIVLWLYLVVTENTTTIPIMFWIQT